MLSSFLTVKEKLPPEADKIIEACFETRLHMLNALLSVTLLDRLQLFHYML
jgi:hypothetical protein